MDPVNTGSSPGMLPGRTSIEADADVVTGEAGGGRTRGPGSGQTKKVRAIRNARRSAYVYTVDSKYKAVNDI
jgi:hypothetical protein